jgi:uncharacterized protein YbaR (Trm112 family)
MFVELLELLRCPRPHDESPLIAAASRTEARHIIDGSLGCPVCGAEFPIKAGVTYFENAPPSTGAEKPNAELAMRLAAFLELSDTPGFAILCGRWGAHADQINRLTQTPLVLVNPPSTVAGEIAAIIRAGDVVPFTGGCARAAALDEQTSRPLAESLAHAVRPGGRVVGPAAFPLPRALTEIVRDHQLWIAAKNDARPPALVPIRRERRD